MQRIHNKDLENKIPPYINAGAEESAKYHESLPEFTDIPVFKDGKWTTERRQKNPHPYSLCNGWPIQYRPYF